uniref:C2H2-type domain-containing protein n=1 Tax=Salix viminalis TaxID=40686 RepID=A0A6N2KWM9_SALVM
MGGKCPSRKFDSRDDAVYEELQKPDGEMKSTLPLDEDLPGMGQYYCLHCDRYFANVTVRDEHFKTKRHRKRVKQMMGPAPHTQLDADLAAGMGAPDNGPKLMSM